MPYDQVQFTLVDCPGHATLMKTVLGGAHIIDMMVLVIDVNKGMQTQTAECLVVGEITTHDLLVVLNKIDMIPEKMRFERIEKVKARLRSALKPTKFRDCKFISVAARPGGADGMEAGGLPPLGMDALVSSLSCYVTSKRIKKCSGTFLFAVDHCFPAKGQGTVMTGTVLRGSCKVGDEIELPELGIVKKVKSMQMFKKPVQICEKGDRLGICVTQLDPKLIERGMLAAPGTVPRFRTAVVLAQKIRYYKGRILSKMKFHVTVGHATAMATAEFFGDVAKEHGKSEENGIPVLTSASHEMMHDTLKASQELSPKSAISHQPLEHLISEFDGQKIYSYYEELENAIEVGENKSEELSDTSTKSVGTASKGHAYPNTTWALLVFDRPIVCPPGGLYIASRLDADIQKNTCRLAFYGRLLQPLNFDLDTNGIRCIKVFKHKKREGVIERLQDPNSAICKGMFKRETDLSLFQGMKVFTDRCEEGTISGWFGKSGKFKVFFKDGVRPIGAAGNVTKLYLHFKRHAFDREDKHVLQ
jgi:selenocysteine-specific elongation factor